MARAVPLISTRSSCNRSLTLNLSQWARTPSNWISDRNSCKSTITGTTRLFSQCSVMTSHDSWSTKSNSFRFLAKSCANFVTHSPKPERYCKTTRLSKWGILMRFGERRSICTQATMNRTTIGRNSTYLSVKPRLRPLWASMCRLWMIYKGRARLRI